MKYFIFILFFSFSAFANETAYILKKSEISYKVNFPLKTVIGKSTETKGKGLCEKKLCEFLIAAPVKSFKSGDTNRDVHMQEVTKSTQYPLVSISISAVDPEKPDNVSLEIEFAGAKKTLSGVHLHKTQNGKLVDVSSAFSILLSDFKVERPTLLGVGIDDQIEINVQTQWENQQQ